MKIKSNSVAGLFVGAAMFCLAGVSSAAIKQISLTGTAELKGDAFPEGGYGIIHSRGMNIAPLNQAVSIPKKSDSAVIYDTIPNDIIGQYANKLPASYGVRRGTAYYMLNKGNAIIESFSSVPQTHVDKFGLTSTGAVTDLSASGFNTESGFYEFKFYLEQFVNANGVAGWAYMNSVMKYDPASGLGYVQTLQCTEKWNITELEQPAVVSEVKANGVADGKLAGDGICGQASVTNIRTLQLNKTAPESEKLPGLMVFPQGSISRIAFDEQDPTKFKVQVSDAVELQLLIDNEMRSVPVPAAVWLFGSAVLGLLGVSRNRKNNKV